MPAFNKYGPIDDVILQDGDRAFLRMNTRLRPNQLQPGEVAYSQNGRMETNGTWQPREGYDNLTGALVQDGISLYALDSGNDGVIPIIANIAIASASLSSNVVTVTTSTAHGLTGVKTIAIEDLTFATTDPNGNQLITISDTTHFTFSLLGGDETYGVGSTPTVEVVSLASNTLVEVLGSCTFSDPTDNAKEYVIVATTNNAIAYELGATDVAASAADIDYPGGTTLSSAVNMTQAFDKVFAFRDGATAWEWDGTLSAVTAGAFVVGKSYTITTVGTTDFTLIGATASTVGVIFVATGVGSGTGTATSGMTAVASGAKTQHKVYQTTSNTTIVSGVATVTEAAHGLVAGDTIYFVDSEDVEVESGAAVVVASVPGVGSFTYYTNASDVTASITYTTKASRLGGGYVNMPAAAWGLYHQRRFWLPYTHDSAASPASRDILDEVIASDILDPATFDPIGNQFVITAGIADYVVALHPFNDDNLLAFNRNSVHLLKGVSGSLGDVETVEITREIGCAARKSAVTYGNQVLFLSDNGVYSLSFLDEYNLRGTELPLSEAISSLVARINPEYISKSVAIYHDNRYFIAVPLDSETENSAILVYSFLNGGWESIDTTSADSFNILDFHVGRANEYNELYAVTTTGGLYQLTATARDKDELINNTVTNELTEYAIPATVTTRQYDMNSQDRKKWNRAEIQVRSNSTSASDGAFSIAIEDPDNTSPLPCLSALIGGDLPKDEGASLITRIGNNRGWGASLTFTPSLGRPSLQAVRLRGMATFKSGTSVT